MGTLTSACSVVLQLTLLQFLMLYVNVTILISSMFYYVV